MKNVVECPRQFFAYFNVLETRGVGTRYYANKNEYLTHLGHVPQLELHIKDLKGCTLSSYNI